MKNIRIDNDGEFRCHNCGQKNFLTKRTARSKVIGAATLGVAAVPAVMMTKKKLKCQTCGEYNDTGNAKPYNGPASRKWRKLEQKALKA